jgi:hypothetical protein
LTTPDLDQLVKAGERHANRVLLKERQPILIPLYHLITASNEDVRIPCNWRGDQEKETMIAVVKATSHIIKAVAMLFITEAWLAKETHKHKQPLNTSWHRQRAIEEARKEALRKSNQTPPSQRPDRIEVVHIIANNGRQTKAKALQMIRDKPGGKLIALVEIIEASNDIDYSGRIIDGIIEVT